MSKKYTNKYISRICNDTTKGWLVRGYRNGVTYSKLFSDRKLGGKSKSFQAASKYRDSLLQKLQSIPKNKRKKSSSRKSPKTGVKGVTITRKKTKSGKEYISYTASWRLKNGKNRSKTFAVGKYGEKKARNLAIKAREDAMIKIYGTR